MESELNTSNKIDELARLRDQIKNLKLENNQLREQSQPKPVQDDNNTKYEVPSTVNILDDILEIKDTLFFDEETWLGVPKSLCKNPVVYTGPLLMKWLRSDADDNNDYEFQVMRKSMITRLEEIQQGSRRNNIDTRTFTRPKKQMSRPGLRTLVDSPLLEVRELMPSLSETLTLPENIEQISMPLNSTFSTNRSIIHESSYLNDNFQQNEETVLNTTFHQVENTRNIMFQKIENIGLKNSSLNRSEDTRLNKIIQNDESPRLNSTFTKILSEPHLNTITDLRVQSPLIGSLGLGQQRMHSNPDVLNETFTHPDTRPHILANRSVTHKKRSLNGQPVTGSTPSLNGTFCIPTNKRAASCDSLDDDYSSTSDNSISASNQPMNAGDVQNIARLQEESLHSTPKSNRQKHTASYDDPPSPIHSHRSDMNHGGYQSDHSDAKSSRSSQMSSPTSSLRGSTNFLSNENGRLPLRLELPKPKPSVPAPRASARSTVRPASGLRPPTVRSHSGASASGLPRPTTNIPRPNSRIPAPKTR